MCRTTAIKQRCNDGKIVVLTCVSAIIQGSGWLFHDFVCISLSSLQVDCRFTEFRQRWWRKHRHRRLVFFLHLTIFDACRGVLRLLLKSTKELTQYVLTFFCSHVANLGSNFLYLIYLFCYRFSSAGDTPRFVFGDLDILRKGLKILLYFFYLLC
jgi:hypothetical protein